MISIRNLIHLWIFVVFLFNEWDVYYEVLLLLVVVHFWTFVVFLFNEWGVYEVLFLLVVVILQHK